MFYSISSEVFYFKKRHGQWFFSLILATGFVLGILYVDWIHAFYSDQIPLLVFPNFPNRHSLVFSLSLWVLSFILIRVKLNSSIYFLGLIKSFLLSSYAALLYKEYGLCSFLFFILTDFANFISTMFLFLVWFGILDEKFSFSYKLFILGLVSLMILFFIEAVLVYPFYLKLFILL